MRRREFNSVYTDKSLEEFLSKGSKEVIGITGEGFLFVFR